MSKKQYPSPSRVAKKWKKLPPGWTDKSVEKFWGTLTGGTPEHKVWDCIDKMTKPFGDGAGAFCGGLADWQMPGWRQKNKKESPEARSDAKSYWKGKIKKRSSADLKQMASLVERVVSRYREARETLLVYRTHAKGRDSLSNANAADLLGSAAWLEHAGDMGPVNPSGNLLTRFEVQVEDPLTPDYAHFSRSGPRYEGGEIPSTVGETPKGGGKWYSFPEEADWKVKKKKSVPLGTPRTRSNLSPENASGVLYDEGGYLRDVWDEGSSQQAKYIKKWFSGGRMASASAPVLKFQRLRGKGKGTLNINVLEEALPLLGWSITKTTAPLRIADPESVKPLLEAMLNPSFVWGYSGTKEPKRVDFDSVEEAKAGLRKWQREAQKGQPPRHPTFKKFYYTQALYPVAERPGGSRFKTDYFFDIVGLWLGVEAYEVTNPSGASVLLPLKPDHRGRFKVDLLRWKMATFWTWAYKNGIQDDAAAYLDTIGAEEVARVTAPASARSLDGTGTCPACFNNVKLRGDRIMRHGWQVQGQRQWGSYGNTWHTGPCFGTGYVAFELSPDGTKDYRDQAVIPYKARVEKELARVKRGTDPITVDKGRRWERVLQPDDPEYSRYQDISIKQGAKAVSDLEQDIRTLDSRITGWKEAPLPGARMASSVRVALRHLVSDGSPLMLQPDYGQDSGEEYHPCQHGLPCQCGGNCGCGSKRAAERSREGGRTKGKSLPETGYTLSVASIYRAVPAGVSTIKPMDYVTRTKKWAQGHADHVAAVEEEEAVVLKAMVKAADVYEASNPGEYLYDGPAVRGRVVYRKRNASIHKTARDFQLTELEITPGQEPTSPDIDFATVITAEFLLDGKTLAKVLGVQERTLERHLAKHTSRKLLHALFSSKEGGRILAALQPKIKSILADHGEEQGQGHPNKLSLDWDADSSINSAASRPGRGVHYTVEVEAYGEWSD